MDRLLTSSPWAVAEPKPLTTTVLKGHHGSGRRRISVGFRLAFAPSSMQAGSQRGRVLQHHRRGSRRTRVCSPSYYTGFKLAHIIYIRGRRFRLGASPVCFFTIMASAKDPGSSANVGKPMECHVRAPYFRGLELPQTELKLRAALPPAVLIREGKHCGTDPSA